MLTFNVVLGYQGQLFRKVTELSYPCNVAATVFAGGCPYPGIEGDQIANKLKDGYRMPKSKHIDQKL